MSIISCRNELNKGAKIKQKTDPTVNLSRQSSLCKNLFLFFSPYSPKLDWGFYPLNQKTPSIIKKKKKVTTPSYGKPNAIKLLLPFPDLFDRKKFFLLLHNWDWLRFRSCTMFLQLNYQQRNNNILAFIRTFILDCRVLDVFTFTLTIIKIKKKKK